MSKNPLEIVTIILEDYVKTPMGLTKVFTDADLMKYWFPLSKMPKNGGDWPRVADMVAGNQRLLVFTSAKSKEATEGIAHQWNYMVENQCKSACDNVSWSVSTVQYYYVVYWTKIIYLSYIISVLSYLTN